jgi:2-polyprenyl-3-methyl-5-hydroxy-6-metoxy-1,4-benzoquinol methylase
MLELIHKKSPLQKKKIEKHLSKRNQKYFQEAEKFSIDYAGYLESQNIPLDYAIDAYIKLCSNMMKCQIEFMKTGRYPVDSSLDAFGNVYNCESEMKPYMLGLAISQFLWETHYEMYSFFKDYIAKNYAQIHSYLEVGPGHGLFLNKAMEYLNKKAKITVVDISPIAINITKSIINYFDPQNTNIKYYDVDMLKLDLNEKYDFITMGEVLEHVNYPEELLIKLRNLLVPNGRAFVSTNVNSPAIDHVYHFKSVDEIRDMFHLYGLEVVKELVLPVEDLPMDEIMEKKITINYCAILKEG